MLPSSRLELGALVGIRATLLDRLELEPRLGLGATNRLAGGNSEGKSPRLFAIRAELGIGWSLTVRTDVSLTLGAVREFGNLRSGIEAHVERWPFVALGLRWRFLS